MEQVRSRIPLSMKIEGENLSQSVSVDDNPPSPHQGQEQNIDIVEAPIEAPVEASIERQDDSIIQKALGLNNQQIIDLCSPEKKLFAMNILSNN